MDLKLIASLSSNYWLNGFYSLVLWYLSEVSAIPTSVCGEHKEHLSGQNVRNKNHPE